MPALIERVRELSRLIKSLAASQVTEAEARGFATRAEELSGPSNAISVPARRFELFTAKGIQVEPPSSEARTLKRSIDQLKAKYDADPRSILAPDATWRHVTKNAFDKLGERVNTQLLAAWREHLAGLKPILDQGLLYVLRSSPTHAVHTRSIEQLNAEFDRLAQRLPISQEEVDKPEQIAEALRRIFEDLPTDIPQPVRELFVAINLETATAAQLTDEAVKWLREKELLQTLRISWKSN